VDLSELKALIRILEESGLSELEIEEEGRRVRLQKPTAGVSFAPVPVVQPLPVATSATPSPRFDGSAAAAPAEPAPGDGLPTFDAPMVGTFYASPSPGSDPFVKVGDRVEVNQTVCIVEAMKLMNEVGAKFAGIIEHILVENAQPVEFGQPLFAVRPLD
jgi:acetyl-CoA carboxylase biotin carboxyl carrier protein